MAVSPDGQYVATGSLDQTAKIWEMQTGRLVNTFQVHYPVISIAFTAESRHLVTNAPGNTAKVWPIEGNGPGLELRGHEGLVFAVAVAKVGVAIAGVIVVAALGLASGLSLASVLVEHEAAQLAERLVDESHALPRRADGEEVGRCCRALAFRQVVPGAIEWLMDDVRRAHGAQESGNQ